MEHTIESPATILDAAEKVQVILSIESVEMKAISGTRPSIITHREIIEEDEDVLSSDGEIIRATDEVLVKGTGPRVANRIKPGLPVKPERKMRDDSLVAHLSTLHTIRSCMGEEDRKTKRDLAHYFGLNQPQLPSESEMLELAWYQYPPRAMLKAQVCDIYSDHAKRSEISVGEIERT
jgi:hypothetical protein